MAGLLKQLAWWFFAPISALWSIYAIYMGILEALSQLGMAVDAPQRAVPIMFIFHALSGSVVLLSGLLQFKRDILTRNRKIHHLIGRIYVGAVWISGLGGLTSAIFFDVNIAAKFVFVTLAMLWLATTTIAFLRARKREISEHREWMLRSFSLSLFVVTFSFWVPGLASTSLGEAVVYPLSVFLSWFLNLLVAEIWIRATRGSLSVRTLAKLANERV